MSGSQQGAGAGQPAGASPPLGQPGHGHFNRPVKWSNFWVVGFGVVAVMLLVSVFFRVPFMVWSLATLVLFGTMEGVGVAKVSDKCPPLTDIIREYIPRWLAFALIYFMVGMAGGTWFRFAHRWGLALLAGLLGWLTAHFEVTFNAPAVEQESVKYSWWAGKLGAHKLRDSLVRRQQRRSLDEQRRLAFKSGR